ncbi:MAG: SDR family NAD(P)-dependent oxidoreductase, partial [Gaiellales bacterium]
GPGWDDRGEGNRFPDRFRIRQLVDAQRHAGKVVLVTGGGSGIGHATAVRFAREGAERVYLVDRAPDRLETVAAELEGLGTIAGTIRADLSEIEECDRAVGEALADAGRLDVAISNAAAWTQEPFLELKDESWLRVIAVNLTAYFAIGQRAARAMAENDRGGVILFTASVSSLGGSPEFSHYNAAKAGVANLAQTMALELVSHGIRVNCVSPGPSDTQQSVDLVGLELMEQWRREGFPVVPMGRLGTPADMAGAFSYLASEDAAYVTGINLVVDGGLTAHAYSVPAT